MTACSPNEPQTTLAVRPEDAGVTIMEYVSRYFINESKTVMRRMIGDGRILMNGMPGPASYRVYEGDSVTVPACLDASPPPEGPLELEILHDGPDHICVNKPPGMPVMPGRDGLGRAFYESLVTYMNRDAPDGGPYVRPHIVHRLDAQTSGVLLVARNVEGGRNLGGQFQKRLIHKRYVAIIEGALPKRAIEIDLMIARVKAGQSRMHVVEKRGKPAVTRVYVRERFKHFTLLDLEPLTGRQHQLRVHLSTIGYPLAADVLYGRRQTLTGADLNAILKQPVADPDDVLLDRHPLHAGSITYTDPTTGEPAERTSPLPDDMEHLVALLREFDAE